MQPHAAGRQRVGFGGEARRDEAEREEHGPPIDHRRCLQAMWPTTDPSRLREETKTMAVLSINGLSTPNDFPASPFEALYKKLGGAYGGRPEYDVLVFGALNAITYRFHALAEYDRRFTASINAQGTDFGQPSRYEQERDLFGFFSNATSIFDAFCFALFAVGALIQPADFPLATDEDEWKVNWGRTREAYRRAFPADPILSVLENMAKDTALIKLRTIRNILTHRGVGGRALMATTGPSDRIPRLNISLDVRTTSTPRSQVAGLLCFGLEAAHTFVESRV
jgi:hypothetical protein